MVQLMQRNWNGMATLDFIAASFSDFLTVLAICAIVDRGKMHYIYLFHF